MELLEGQTLSERLEKGALPTEQVLKFGVEIADALDKAHRAGIVHRDLKPGNVMITKSGVKLLDFGLAKAVGSRTELSDLSSLPTEAERPLTEQRNDSRDVPIHVAGTAGGQGGRPAVRHLRVRLRALRNGDRKKSVHRGKPGVADFRPS